MERLTMVGTGGGISEKAGVTREMLRDRLAAYEDTGLEPEDCMACSDVLELRMYRCIGSIPELRAMKEAQDERRVAVSFATGDTVWIIERDEDGEACEVSGYVFLTETAGYAFVSPTVNGSSDVKDILADAVERTAWGYHANFGVYPITDCYKTRTEAEAVLQEGGPHEADPV